MLVIRLGIEKIARGKDRETAIKTLNTRLGRVCPCKKIKVALLKVERYIRTTTTANATYFTTNFISLLV